MEELGSPHLQVPPTIHVAGTNGKCSTIAFMRSILEHSGLKVHVFTSPHLLKVNERITLAGQDISDAYFKKLNDQLSPIIDKHALSWFEALTVIAFQAFKEVPADILLLEVGLGGQYDATNVITPIASVITPISYDHQHYLGGTLQQIAHAKAGIIKPNVPVFSAAQHPDVYQVLKQTALENKSPLSIQDQDWVIEEAGNHWVLNQEPLPYPQRLLGKHQLQNAALAVMTLKSLNLGGDVQEGIKTAYVPGRLMKLSNPNGSEIWFDGAHNPGAAVVLKDFFAARKSMPIYVICGLLKTKDPQAFIDALRPITDQFIFVPIPNHSDCYPVEELVTYDKGALTAEGVQQALTLIKGKPATILICGSFYLASEVL